MDFKALGERVVVPDLEECGPAMRALNENQRRYVCALGVYGNNQTWAYQWAFDSNKERSACANSARLASQDKIKAAVKEHYQGRLHLLGPALAAEAILEALSPQNLDIKLKMKAVELASNIIPGFKAATAHEITVKHEYSLEELEQARIRLEKEMGIKMLTAPVAEVIDVIEAEFSEVDPDLADLL